MTVKLRLSAPQQQALRLIATGVVVHRGVGYLRVDNDEYQIVDPIEDLIGCGLAELAPPAGLDRQAALTELGARWVAENPEETA
jgi:hypothetical protein